MNGFDSSRWSSDGYTACLDGIKQKFLQNRPILEMLKTMQPKILVEASTDKVWGTGILIRDNSVLNTERWHSVSWMLTILEKVREEALT